MPVPLLTPARRVKTAQITHHHDFADTLCENRSSWVGACVSQTYPPFLVSRERGSFTGSAVVE